MANEITISAFINVLKGNLSYTQNQGSIQFDMSGSRAVGGTATSSGTAVALPLSTVPDTALGWVYMKNTSSVAGEDIQIGTGTGTFVPLLMLKPREIAVFRFNSSAATTPTFRSTSGSPILQYWIVEN